MEFRAALIPLGGGPPIEVLKETIVIGRQPECDLCLDQKGVSKLHCVLVKTDGLLVLRDLGSTNGTRVNGTRVRRAALLPNDKISFANLHFKVHLGPPDVPIPTGENTEAISLGEVNPGDEDSHPSAVRDPKADAPPVVRNELPDLYPEPKKKRTK
jgi:pSer/pThr/pTyr-binding forkhead associated (FHA) protein